MAAAAIGTVGALLVALEALAAAERALVARAALCDASDPDALGPVRGTLRLDHGEADGGPGGNVRLNARGVIAGGERSIHLAVMIIV
jgi:hypothetical protein